MTLLDWGDELCVGVETIDKEHRGLIETINKLQEAVESGKERRTVGPLLSEMAKGVRVHFSSEEEIMTAAEYPGATLHALKHQHLLEQMIAFFTRYKRDPSVLNQYALNFLRDAVMIHIQGDDLNFGLWLNEQRETAEEPQAGAA